MRALILAVTALAHRQHRWRCLRAAKHEADDGRNESQVSAQLLGLPVAGDLARLSPVDGEHEANAVMMFIEGCIMGRQR